MESINIKVKGVEYQLSEYVDQGYIDAELYNRVLDQAKMFLCNVQFVHKHPQLMYKVFVYDSNQINAFALKRDGIYIIAISVGSLLQLKCWFDLWTNSPTVRDILEIDASDAIDYSKSMIEMAIDFLVAHEYYHVLNGHCDLPEIEEHFIFESKDPAYDKEHNLFLQCLEYDADCCAAASCINQAVYSTLLANALVDFLSRLSEQAEIEDVTLPQKKFGEEEEQQLIPKFRTLFFSIYGVFKLFSEADQISFLDFIKDEPYKDEHPYTGVRFYSVLCMLPTVLGRMLGGERAEVYLNNIIDSIFRFETAVIGIRKPGELFFSIAVTQKGEELLREISDAWEHVRPRIEQYSHHELAPFVRSKYSRPVLDDDGNVICQEFF